MDEGESVSLTGSNQAIEQLGYSMDRIHICSKWKEVALLNAYI